MHTRFVNLRQPALCLLAIGVTGLLGSSGCATSAATTLLGGSLFTTYTGSSSSSTTGGSSGQSSFFGTGSGVAVDPCAEPNSRKFIRISMRNLSSDSYIHYFLVLIAYVNGDTYPDGAVCPDDTDLYTSFGYQEILEGNSRAFGNYCIEGPALFYYHDSGQFQGTGGTSGSKLASAIAPAQGTNASYDNFFVSGGVPVPVPNEILFHNPGTGEGAALKVSINNPAPCSEQATTVVVTADCDQDAFYYVDESDLIAGSVFLGAGSGRRVPNEIQETGCECLGTQDPFQVLATSGTTASTAQCNEFLRGGAIEYAFVRDDTNPPYPQLVWEVTDQSGAVVHEFDPRANVP